MAFQSLVRITNRFMRASQCDFCTIPLTLSVWKGEIAVYAKSQNQCFGFLCVKCAMRRKKNGLFRATEKDFDDFVFEVKSHQSTGSLDYDNAWS